MTATRVLCNKPDVPPIQKRYPTTISPKGRAKAYPRSGRFRKIHKAMGVTTSPIATAANHQTKTESISPPPTGEPGNKPPAGSSCCTESITDSI